MAGHLLSLQSLLTEGQWRIWSDNITMARWLQSTNQGVLNPEPADISIPVEDAMFEKEGDPDRFYSKHLISETGKTSLTWHNLGDPLMIHTQPGTGPSERPYVVNALLILAMGRRLVMDGMQASVNSWALQRDGHPFSTSALAFCESWTEKR